MNENNLNENIQPENSSDETRRNDTAGYDDDTLGENTEITPLAKEILEDQSKKVQAKENQENKDVSGEEG